MEEKTNEEVILEIKMEVLERQLDALTRVLNLVPARNISGQDIFDILAQAEIDAQFVCGFAGLNESFNEKVSIVENAISLQLVSVDGDGYLTLTPRGLERSKTELPEPIERKIKAKHMR